MFRILMITGNGKIQVYSQVYSNGIHRHDYSDLNGVLHADIFLIDKPKSYDLVELVGKFDKSRGQRATGLFGKSTALSKYIAKNSRMEHPLVLDFEKVEEFDSSGVSTLLRLLNMGKRIALIHPAQYVKNTLDVLLKVNGNNNSRLRIFDRRVAFLANLTNR